MITFRAKVAMAILVTGAVELFTWLALEGFARWG